MIRAVFTGLCPGSDASDKKVFLLPAFCCLAWSGLVSNLAPAAEANHGNYAENFHACLQEIGSQVYVEGAKFVMGA